MVEKHTRLCALFLQIKTNDGIRAGVPSGGTPGLDDALVGDEFDIATEDSCTEHGEGSAGFAMDVSRLVGEGRELLGVKKDGVDACGSGLEIDLLAQGSAGGVGRRWRSGLLRGGKKVGGANAEECDGSSGDEVAASEIVHVPPVERMRLGEDMETREAEMFKRNDRPHGLWTKGLWP